jgi:uracil-DNA glycosylase family 4
MSLTTTLPDRSALIASLTDWWSLAGLDCAVADAPRPWTTSHSVMPAVQAVTTLSVQDASGAPVRRESPPVTRPLPDTLEAFMAYLQQDPSVPESAFPGARIMPRLVKEAPLLVIADMPSDADMTSGTLMSGDEGELIAAMMRAIGLSMDTVALATLLLSRPPGGGCPEPVWSEAADRMSHLIGLLAPQSVLLLGDRTNRALGKTDGSGLNENLLVVNSAKGNIRAMSIPAPSILMRYPQRKAAAWSVLCQLGAEV